MDATRRVFVRAVALCCALPSIPASAQPPGKLPRVALVFTVTPITEMIGADPASPFAREFVHELRSLGWVDGRNVIVERRSAEGHPERLPQLMRELVALGVDVIVTTGPGVRAAVGATSRIPIVALIDAPVESGFVSSLARPGGNLTGYGVGTVDHVGKWLQLLKEAAPAASRVAVIAQTPPEGSPGAWRTEIDSAARTMRMAVLWLAVDADDQFDRAFGRIARERANALLVPPTPLNTRHLRQIADFAIKRKLPSMSPWREFADAGGLIAYGDDGDPFRHGAVFVKKILEGAKPGDLPFEQPTKFELVLNLKTAKAIGVVLPQSLLLRADERIE